MGTNKRYAAYYDRQMDARVRDDAMRSGEPDPLTPAQLDLGHSR